MGGGAQGTTTPGKGGNTGAEGGGQANEYNQSGVSEGRLGEAKNRENGDHGGGGKS